MGQDDVHDVKATSLVGGPKRGRGRDRGSGADWTLSFCNFRDTLADHHFNFSTSEAHLPRRWGATRHRKGIDAPPRRRKPATGMFRGPQWNRDRLMSNQAREATTSRDCWYIQLEVGKMIIRNSRRFSRLDSHRVCRARRTVDQTLNAAQERGCDDGVEEGRPCLCR